MPKAQPLELRERVVHAVEEEGDTYAEAAARFMVGEASVSRWLRRARDGRLEATKRRLGRVPQISGEAMESLVQLLEERPEDTIAELMEQFGERTGIQVSASTMGRAIRSSGYTRKKRR